MLYIGKLGKRSNQIDITFAPHRLDLNTSEHTYQLPLNKKIGGCHIMKTEIQLLEEPRLCDVRKDDFRIAATIRLTPRGVSK